MKILVVSDALSRSAAFAGRHRIEGFVRHWIAAGHEVHALTPEPHIPLIVEGCRYHCSASKLLSHVYDSALGRRLTRSVRYHVLKRFLLPDEWALWAVLGRRELKRVWKRYGPFDMIVSSFGSASSHLLAGWAARVFDSVSWVADYRDIWTDNQHHRSRPLPLYLYSWTQPSRLSWLIQDRMERRVLRHAAAVTTVTPRMARILEHKVGSGTSVHVVPHGFEPRATTRRLPHDQLVLSLTGKLNNSADWREIRWLFEAVRRTLDESEGWEQRIKLNFMGGESHAIRRLAAQSGLEHLVTAVGYCPYDEAVQVQARSDALLLMLPTDADITRGVLPRKLFDYLAAERPILAIVAADSDAAAVIQQTRTGCIASSPQGVRKCLTAWMHEIETRGAIAYAPDAASREAYLFSALAPKMLDALAHSPAADGRAGVEE